jgi:hypothetical protein
MSQQDPRVITIELLQSIDRRLAQLVAVLTPQQSASVADDRDLDSKYGDPVLKFSPRDWRGASYKNCKFSECPPELLDLVADSLDYFARKSEEQDERTSNGKPLAPFKRKDAARARGWAKRIRAGYKVNRATGELTEPGDSQGFGADLDTTADLDSAAGDPFAQQSDFDADEVPF